MLIFDPDRVHLYVKQWLVVLVHSYLLNIIDDFNALGDFTENRVLAVQPETRYRGDEKLGSICVFAAVGHR